MANNNVSFAGPIAGSIVTPAAQKMTLQSNYLNFHGSGGANWSQQYLPELYAQEVERYGNRSVSSFLRMVGAEMPMASDQVIWSEQGRLHIAYEIDGENVKVNSATANTIDVPSGHLIQNHDTIIVANSGATKVLKCLVINDATSATRITVAPYTQLNLSNASSGAVNFTADEAVNIFVYGTEYKKGSSLSTYEKVILSLEHLEGVTQKDTFQSTKKEVLILRKTHLQ